MSKKLNSIFCNSNFTKLFHEKLKSHYSISVDYFQIIKNKYFPYMRIVDANSNIFVTFPCFSGPQNISKNFLIEITEKMNFEGGYIQSNGEIEKLPQNFIENFDYNISYKKNFYFDLKNDFNFLINNKMNENSKRVARKFIDEKKKINIKLTKNSKNIENFLSSYSQSANSKNFSFLFKFNLDEIKYFLKNKFFKLFSVYKNEQYLGGCILSYDKCDKHASVVLITYNYLLKNSSRYTYFTLICFLNKYCKKISIGGSYTKDDSLEKFKLGMGCQSENFYNIKFCKKNSNLNSSFKNNKKWPLK